MSTVGPDEAGVPQVGGATHAFMNYFPESGPRGPPGVSLLCVFAEGGNHRKNLVANIHEV